MRDHFIAHVVCASWPRPNRKERFKTQFEMISVPFSSVREDDSRGAKHWQTQWQYDFWKARDAKRSAKTGKDSIVLRWQEDEKYRASYGWTKEYCRYLDYLASIDTSHVAKWKERSRYENSLVLKLNDELLPGRMTNREDFPQAARALGSSPTSTRTGESSHPEKRTRATTTIRRKIAIRSSVAKMELESQLVAGIIFVFNRVVAFKKMARTTTRKMAR